LVLVWVVEAFNRIHTILVVLICHLVLS
jgi:hypothetical protein